MSNQKSNNNINTKNKKKCCCFSMFTKSKPKPENRESSLFELNYILNNKKNLLQLDSKSFSKISTIMNPFRSDNSFSIINNGSPSKITTSNKTSRKATFNSRSNILKKDSFSIPKEKKFFHEFKDKIRCFFCGGKRCKHEDFTKNENPNNAITGLNSNYITPNVIASQRPSELLIQKYSLISVFKQMNIGLIVNLQREGEHPYCGPNAYNLTSAGYSYNPSMFSGDDIRCKLSGWKDMEVPSSMNFMLDIVKDMTAVVKDEHKKVLVHCHAGYGRTGVVIACYMLFNSEEDSDSIIRQIREKRHKCIETKDQRSYCKKFEEFLDNTRLLFDNKEKIDVYLKRQEDLLYGEETKKYGFVPKLITKTLEKISSVKEKYSLDNLIIYQILEGEMINWNEELENILIIMKRLLNKNNWELFDATENLLIINEILFDWMEDAVEWIISPERTASIMEMDYFVFNTETETLEFKINNKNDFFKEIRNIYHCFEYETLFQIASFLTFIPPKDSESSLLFNKMIDRISCGLLGLSYADMKTGQEYQKENKSIVMVLSSIIKCIYQFLNQNELSENDIKIVSPVRRTTVTFFAKLKGWAKKDDIIEDYLKTPPPNSKTKRISDSVNSSHSISLNNASLIKNSNVSKKEKKLFQIYEILAKHFQNKDENGVDSNTIISSFNMPNEILENHQSDNNASSLNKKDSNYAPKDLKKIIEEVLSQKSSSITPEEEEDESDDLKNIIKKQIKNVAPKIQTQPDITNKNNISTNSVFNKHSSALNNFLHDAKNDFVHQNSSVITFESFRKSIFEARTPGAPGLYTPSAFKRFFKNKVERVASQMTESEPGIRGLELKQNSSLMRELKKYNLRNSEHIKQRKQSMCYNRGHRLSTFMNQINKVKITSQDA